MNILFRIKLSLYQILVGRNEFIKEEYLTFVENRTCRNYIFSMKEIIRLNFKYAILRQTPEKLYKKIKYPETSHATRPEPGQILPKALMADIISFDIFDTMLLRIFDKPEDLFIILGNELGIPNFRYLRKEAEIEARKCTEKKNREINIWDIYEVLEKWCGLSCKTGVEKEVLLEKQFCFVNPYMKELFDKLKEYNKRIIFTTDMYLTNELLDELLHYFGISGYEKIFVSCEFGCGKNNGELQRYIKKENGEALKYFHIGDNYNADIFESEKEGWQTEYYPKVSTFGKQYRPYNMTRLIGSIYKGLVNSQFYAKCESQSLYYEYGFACGILVVGFCKWLNTLAEVEKFDKFFFVARDGDIVSHIYEKYFKKIDYQYLLFSRMASEQIMFCDFTEEYIQHSVLPEISENTYDFKLPDLLQHLGLGGLNEKISDTEFDKLKILSVEDYDAIRNLIYTHKEDIGKIFEPSCQAARKYFTQSLGNSKNICVVDVGWRGTSFAYIKHLLQNVYQTDIQVSGAMLSAAPESYAEGFLAEGKLWTYTFSELKNRHFGKKICQSRDNMLCTEMLFSSVQPTLLQYSLNDEGEVRFIYKEENEMKEQIEQVQKGIMDFASCYFQKMGAYAYSLNIYPEDALAPLFTILQNQVYVKKLMEKCGKRANARHGFKDTGADTT